MPGILSGWTEMAAALLAFFASHILPVRPPVRRFLRSRLGNRGYALAYSLLSLAILAWLIGSASRAPQIQLWDFESWQLWVPNIAMPLAILLGVYGVGNNPFSIGAGDGDGFDPERPGIAGITRHPPLWAITLWALSHIVPNGDLAHVMLFGLFAVFGIAGMIVLDARKRREWGAAVFEKRAARTSVFPFVALICGRGRIGGLRLEPAKLLLAAGLYLAALLLHPALIGVSPLPA